MPLYLLGISRRRDVPNVPEQAAGSVGVCWSLAGELACAFIDALHQAVPPMLHAAILEAIHRRICVLPVRFGVALRDEADVHAMLDGRRDEWLDRLGQLESTCEMGVQIVRPALAEQRRPATTTASRPCAVGAGAMPARCPASGTRDAASSDRQSPLAYVEERRSYYRRADQEAERDQSTVQHVVERLHGCFRQWRKLPSSSSCRVRLAFLVERDGVAAFKGNVENAREACQGERCLVLGPWPPYSFV